AHTCGIPVEAELGQIGKMGDSDEPGVALEKVKGIMAVPEEAAKFVELTEIDFLAAAVGTIHGCRTPFAKLDIPRIEKIRELTGVPLVLHGASGANDEEVRKGIAAGICKINIDTRIRLYFVKKMREILEKNPEEIDPRKILGPAKEAAKEIIRDRMRVFGCNGKA
ncbi:MAG: tagatose-bisphosphate aldolase subunit KbaY, partial [Atribacteria sp.]|nr:tagatose-bisphosphate aldolase subunit KbaY [Candidatus Atribacteria bacterium]